jgi:hypothetical protein
MVPILLHNLANIKISYIHFEQPAHLCNFLAACGPKLTTLTLCNVQYLSHHDNVHKQCYGCNKEDITSFDDTIRLHHLVVTQIGTPARQDMLLDIFNWIARTPSMTTLQMVYLRFDVLKNNLRKVVKFLNAINASLESVEIVIEEGLPQLQDGTTSELPQGAAMAITFTQSAIKLTNHLTGKAALKSKTLRNLSITAK